MFFRNPWKAVAQFAFLLLISTQQGSAFMVPPGRSSGISPPSIVASRISFEEGFSSMQSRKGVTRRHGALHARSKPADGTGGRGLVVFGIVFAACVWIFSIPPEFRRAHICTAEYCVEDRAKCYDCVTPDEWKAGIAEYYRNGGGVEFDFTVADETKTFWKGD